MVSDGKVVTVKVIVNPVEQAWFPSLNVWEMKRWCFVGTCVRCLFVVALGFCCVLVFLRLLRIADG